MVMAYLIDAEKREVREIEPGLDAWAPYLPGGICFAWRYPTEDVVYVDDEGLLRKATVAFRLRSRPDGQPMMSHGIVSGCDDVMGDKTLPVAMTREQIEADIEWLTVEEAMTWFRARRDDGAVVLHETGASPKVITKWDRFVRHLEGKA